MITNHIHELRVGDFHPAFYALWALGHDDLEFAAWCMGAI